MDPTHQDLQSIDIKILYAKGSLKTIEIVITNVNSHECFLLARNELSNWILYLQNNLIGWPFIPTVQMRKQRPSGFNNTPKIPVETAYPRTKSSLMLTVRVFHKIYENVLLACLQSSSAHFLSDSMASTSGVMNSLMMSPDTGTLPFSSLLSCFCWLPFQPFHCVH